MALVLTRKSRPNLRHILRRFGGCHRGSTAVEFAILTPVMLLLFFGTNEFASAVTVKRKVTLVARTISDLVSQSKSVSDLDLSNMQITGKAILTPFSPTPLNATVSEIYVDPSTKQAKIIWSNGSSPRQPGSVITLPSSLQVDGTYLIFSEVNYKYMPIAGYVMADTGVTLSDLSYTRPRQNACVIYPTPKGDLPDCPTK